MDLMVLQVQSWLNTTYLNKTGYTPVMEDGITGWSTIKALITALQIEEGIAAPNGNFGPTTMSLCPTLSTSSNSSNITTNHEIRIIQGALYCKGYNPNGFDGGYGNGVKSAIMQFQSDAGVLTLDGITTPMIFKALLNMDAFVLVSGGDPNIRTIQQRLNRDYNNIIGLIPCDGIYSRSTNKALIYALQAEEKIASPDGIWGPNTMSLCPTLSTGSSLTKFIYLLQYALYCNHFNPNGFDGAYGTGVKTAVTNFQKFTCLSADGVAGKQTWASLLVSTGDSSRKGTACDCATSITNEKAVTLKNNGYTVVGRYLTGRFRMTYIELQTIFANGLKVFPIFETAGIEVSYFTATQGINDANSALLAARDLGFSAGTIIYFAVDYDAIDTEVTSNIIPYFKAINEELNRLSFNKYKIGIYGPRNVCSRVAAAGYSCSSFVSDMSTGFSGNLGYSLPSDWAFDQISTVTLGSGSGLIEIDNNIFSGRNIGVDHVTPEDAKNSDTLIKDIDIIKKINTSNYMYDQAEINFNNGVLNYDQKIAIQTRVKNEADIARADYILSNPYSDYAYAALGGNASTGNPLSRVLYNTGSDVQLTGLDVIVIQRVLELYGYFDIPDGQYYGIYGPVTAGAVSNYQLDHIGSAQADGTVGATTMASLFSSENEEQRTPYWVKLLNIWRAQHDLVKLYEAVQLGAETEVTIKKGAVDGINCGYADILKKATRQVWEVKPNKPVYYGVNGIGTKQLTRYINASAITNQFGDKLVAGFTVPDAFIDYTPDEYIYIHGGTGPDPQTGLVLYEVRTYPEPEVETEPSIQAQPEVSMKFDSEVSTNLGTVAGICLLGGAVFLCIALAPETGGASLIPLAAGF